MNISLQIEKLISKNDLSKEESYLLMKEILAGCVLPAQIAALLTALRSKGEAASEIAGFVKAMREAMVPIHPNSPVVIDTCGTGGDGKGTFNISTASAFVAAGAGYTVAKHGNRSISSQCGSADVLEALGVKVEMTKETAEKCLNEIGITFLFAPIYHPAMKNVGSIRKELGIRTIFNLLGPMLNPANANAQVVGVAKKELVPILAKVFKDLDSCPLSCEMIVHENGYDEIALNSKGKSALILNKKVQFKNFTPKTFKMKRVNPMALKGGNAKENALLLKELFSTKDHPLKDVVIVNAALAIFCASSLKFRKQKKTISDAIEEARESLLNGSALEKLNKLIDWSNR